MCPVDGLDWVVPETATKTATRSEGGHLTKLLPADHVRVPTPPGGLSRFHQLGDMRREELLDDLVGALLPGHITDVVGGVRNRPQARQQFLCRHSGGSLGGTVAGPLQSL